MEVRLTPEQEANIIALAARSVRSLDDIIQEALGEWAARATAMADFRATLDAAEASIAEGGGRVISQDSMGSLADEVKRRGREQQAVRESSRLL